MAETIRLVFPVIRKRGAPDGKRHTILVAVIISILLAEQVQRLMSNNRNKAPPLAARIVVVGIIPTTQTTIRIIVIPQVAGAEQWTTNGC